MKVEEIVGNLVEQILQLPEGTETTTLKLLQNLNVSYNKENLFEIDSNLRKEVQNHDILLDSSLYAGLVIDLPYNMPFIKKTISNEDSKENEITEILIVIKNDKYIIKQNEIKEFVDGVKYFGKEKIKIDQFKNISNVVLNYTNNWNKYFTNFFSNEVNWKIQIKTGKNSKRYAGTDYPENWKEFYIEIMFVIKGTKDKLEPNFDTIESDYNLLNQSKESEEDNIGIDILNEQKIIQINNEYHNNGINFSLVNLINDFVVNSIEDDKVDIFWSDSARRLLGLEIVANLLNNNKLSSSLLLEQLKESNKLKEVIKNNLNEINTNVLLKNFSCISGMVDSDKFLRSTLKIIERSFVKSNPTDEEDKKLENTNIDLIFKRANQGDHEAINELTYRHFYGEGTYKDEKNVKEYLEKIEIDLCIALIYYLFALRPEEEQNLNRVFELLSSKRYVVQHMMKVLPVKHSARVYYSRLTHLKNKEYYDIVERLRIKVDKCRKNDKFLKIPEIFDNEEDVTFYATCVVKSYEYSTIEDYVRDLLKKKDDAALIFVGKLFIKGEFVEKNIKKGLEYLLVSKKQNPEISKENRDSCIFHIESTTKDPEIQLLLGKHYLEIPYYKREGFELIQNASEQGCKEANEIITNMLQEIRKDYKLKYPEDFEYECLFEIEKLTNDPKIQLLLVYYSEYNIKKSTDYENLVKRRCLKFIRAYANEGYEVARNFLNNKMEKIKNNYKNTKKLSEYEIEFIYNYSMNDYEKEKIKELNLEERMKLLQTDSRQTEFWNNSLKYIENLGYMFINMIYYWGEGGCSRTGGKTTYILKIGPIIDFNIAKKKITEEVEDAIKARKL